MPRLLRTLLPLLPALALACAEETTGAPPPIDQLYFPSGAAMSPEADGQSPLLLVASSNFDLRFRSGVLHAFDVEALDELVATAPPPEGCPPDAPNCRPVRVLDYGDALLGAVEIGDFAGQMAIAPVDDGPGALQRAFVPVRGNNTVVPVDLVRAPGEPLRCVRDDCAGVRFPRPDPFAVVAVGGNVYVSHVTRSRTERPRGIVGAAAIDGPIWSDGGAFAEIPLGDEGVGGIAAGACRETGDGPTCTLFATGRSIRQGINPVYLFDFRPGEFRTSPVFRRDVFAQQRGLDNRGLAVAAGGDRIYTASRFPAAVATIDVSRVDPSPRDGCVVPPGEQLPREDLCPAEPVPLDGVAEPRFVTANLVTLPPEPNTVVSIPRVLPGGGSSDLVVVTTRRGLAFYDTRADQLAALVEEVGTAPSSLPWRPFGSGIRMYVPSYGRGTLAIVDVPDLFRPTSARVVAILGRLQEGGF